MKRRQFLEGIAAGVLAEAALPLVSCVRATASAKKADAESIAIYPKKEGTAMPEVRIEYLHPKEIEERMGACPTLFQPLGTVEWHGKHNWVGVDALKAHALCVQAAQRGGGLVAPPVYGGVGGLDQPHTFVMEPENSLGGVYVRPWVEKLCSEAVRQGFKAVIILTGHYGAGQQMIVRELAVRMSRLLGVPILGTPEYVLALDEGYSGDHAAWGETSLMMHLYPGSVDLSRLGEAPHQGVGGRDPKLYATAADGKRLADRIVERLARLAARMPQWDGATLDRFIAAEGALVDRQIRLAAETGKAWEGWRKIGDGKTITPYGQALAEERFEEIAQIAANL
ncbi:MAG: creatininase family protein [bacterium]|nr:creatininase family protein [bacterium]